MYFSRDEKFIDKFEGLINDVSNARIDSEFSEFDNAEGIRNQLKCFLKKTCLTWE